MKKCKKMSALYSGGGHAPAEVQFRNAMLDAGLVTDEPLIANGEIHRFKNEGDRKKNAWYVLHHDHGAAGDWKLDIKITWTANKSMDPGDRRKLRQRIKTAQRQHRQTRKQQHAEAAARALEIWNAASPAEYHDYLLKKAIEPHGARTWGAFLLVPLMTKNRIWSLQSIRSYGRKKFMPGGRTKGCYYLLGERTPRIWIAEGFATAGTLREATGDCTCCAFTAYNLAAVCKALWLRWPDSELVIAADEDPVGLAQGEEAMYAGHAVRMVSPGDSGMDWNDYGRRHGLTRLREELTHG